MSLYCRKPVTSTPSPASFSVWQLLYSNCYLVLELLSQRVGPIHIVLELHRWVRDVAGVSHYVEHEHSVLHLLWREALKLHELVSPLLIRVRDGRLDPLLEFRQEFEVLSLGFRS